MFAARFSKDGRYLQETFYRVAAIGVRASLPGWLKKLEITIRARNQWDATTRHRAHFNERIALFDDDGTLVCSGWVKEVRKDGRFIEYIAAGAWENLRRTLVTSVVSKNTLSDEIKRILTNEGWYLSTDYAHIGTNYTSVGNAYDVSNEKAKYPQAVIEDFLEMSDNQGDVWDFWLRDRPLMANQLQDPWAFYRKRTATARPDWVMTERELTERGLRQARNIWQYVSSVQVYYDDGAGGLTTDGGTTAGSAAYGTVERVLSRGDFTQTQANQLEQLELNRYALPIQEQAFEVGAPKIASAAGIRHWVTDLIKYGPTYMQMILAPDVALARTRSDGFQSWFITAVDWDNRTGVMRVQPMLPDRALDAKLVRERSLNEIRHEMVHRSASARRATAPAGYRTTWKRRY